MKTIFTALVAVIIMTCSQAYAGPLSSLMETVEKSMPILERLANPTETDLKVHCLGNVECIEGMRRDAQSLSKALDMLNDQRHSYNANKRTVAINEEMLRGTK